MFTIASVSSVLETILMYIFGFINQFLPMNFMYSTKRVSELVEALFITLQMVVITGVFAIALGLLVGIVYMVSKKGGLLENRICFFVTDKIINFFRSVPFVILIGVLTPLSIAIVGTRIGIRGMYIPLIFGTFPFFARQVESTLSEVDEGLIEASIAMGDTPFQTITKVYLRESIPGLIRGASIALISLIGLTAMAGQIGGGGLGNFALRYGYDRQMTDATWATVAIILVMVSIIQGLSNYFAKKATH